MFSLSDFGHTFFDSSIVGVCSIHRCKLLASGILRHKSDTCPYNFVSLELTRILFLFFLFFFQFSHTKIQLASFPLVINLLLTNPKKLKKKKKTKIFERLFILSHDKNNRLQITIELFPIFFDPS